VNLPDFIHKSWQANICITSRAQLLDQRKECLVVKGYQRPHQN